MKLDDAQTTAPLETRADGAGQPVTTKVAATPPKKTATPPKAPRKSTRSAKPAKKQETKMAKKAKAKKSGGGKRRVSDPEAKIVVVRKENPHREGSPKAKMLDKIFQHNGKKVQTYLDNRGDRKRLSSAVRRGLVKLAA